MTIEPARGAPLILPFDGIQPRLGNNAVLGSSVSVLGKVEIGANAIISAGAVIRGDGHFVRIGDGFFIGEMGTVHIAEGVYPAIIGNRVTVGRNAVVHACTVGDDCAIEDNAVILDGSIVEDGVLIEADSTVFPRSKLASGFVYAGTPAKPIRVATPGERKERAARLHGAAASPRNLGCTTLKAHETAFIASTARLAGPIELCERASVFFGCNFDAGKFRIAIGENTNIQDNCRIHCQEGETVIGRDTTLGHNVRLTDCRIGERALIGIGCDVAPGTTVEDDVMLGGGAVTEAGQKLESGWLWGGRPARPLSRLDDAKRSLMKTIIEHYCDYAQAYRLAQEQLGGL